MGFELGQRKDGVSADRGGEEGPPLYNTTKNRLHPAPLNLLVEPS